MTEESKIKKRILIRLSKGCTTVDELKILCRLYGKKYKANGKRIPDLIEFESYNELQRRLKTSVFSELGKDYPRGYEKYCIYGEYRNTKLFIDGINKLIKIGQQIGDITSHEFYGQPDSGYIFSTETLVHIAIRHNFTLNSFINKDSIINGYTPASFTKGGLSESMILLLMSLNVLNNNDWKLPV